MSETGRPRGARVAAVALVGLALGATRRVASKRPTGAVSGDDRLDLVEQRLQRIDESVGRRADDLLARLAAVEERVARSEAFATDLQRVVLALSATVAGVDQRVAGAEALTARVEHLEQDTRRLDDEAERAGVLAATAVAATDELDVLVASLRELRRDLLRVAADAGVEREDGERLAAPGAPHGESRTL